MLQVSANQNFGMQFHTADERERYFARAAKDAAFVPFGAAYSHAASVNLGVWGSEDLLRGDCARLMAFEVANHATVKKLELTGAINPEDVLKTDAFNRMFAQARSVPDARLENTLSCLGVKGSLHRFERFESLPTSHSVQDTQQQVFDELVARGAIPV